MEEENLSHRPGIATRFLLGGIVVYQRTLRHLIGGKCRFNPSCSKYANEALRTHGAWRGSWLAFRRVCRCHPWGGQGEDPVPISRRSPD